jgi:hypothetical protein
MLQWFLIDSYEFKKDQLEQLKWGYFQLLHMAHNLHAIDMQSGESECDKVLCNCDKSIE